MRTLLFLLLLSVITFSGCNGKTTNTNTRNVNSNLSTLAFEKPKEISPGQPPDPNFQPCNLYFPLVPGSQAKYLLQYSSPLTADVNVVVEKVEENGSPVYIERTQIIDKSGGLYKNELSERKYSCDNGRLQLLSEKTDNRTEKNASKMEMEFRNQAVFMPDPTSFSRTGTTWSYSFRPIFAMEGTARMEGDLGIVSFEVMGEEKVKVPAGEFNAIKVRRRVKEAVVFDFFVRGIGMVKRAGADGTTWELKEFSGLSEK